MKPPNNIPIILLLLVLSLFPAACKLTAGQPAETPTVTLPPVTMPPLATDTPEPTITPTPTYAPPRGDPIPHMQHGDKLVISQINMYTPLKGWAIGGTADRGANVLTTYDSGNLWEDVTPPEVVPAEGQSQKAAFATFLDAYTAWVVYYYASYLNIPDPAIVWRTTDGGSTWQAAPLPMVDQGEDFDPTLFTFLDAQHGWLMVSVGGGMSHDYTALYRTVDGGQSWEKLIDPYEDDKLQICSKTSMVFSDADHGWITRDCLGLVDGVQLLKTEDGGVSWTLVDLPGPKGAKDVMESPNFCGSHSLKLYGSDGLLLAVDCTIDDDSETHSRSYTYWSSDGGKNWTIQGSPGGELVMFSATQGYLLGRKIYSTEDRGGDWTQVKSVNWDGQFSFVAPRLGWAVAHNEKQITLVYTEDYGKTWREIKTAIYE